MKRILICSVFFVHLFHFGVSAQNERVKLKTFNDSVSYVLGVESAVGIFNSDEKFEALDKAQLVTGFQTNLHNIDASDCAETIQEFLGPQALEFNTAYLKEGSLCIGRMSGYYFYTQMIQLDQLSNIDFDLVKLGFKQGAYEKYEKHLSYDQCAQVIQRFSKILEANFLSDIEERDQIFWKDVLSKPNLEQIGETGIYFETIKQGTGGKPTIDSDIEAHYILTNALGDTLESSYAAGKSLKINLGSVISGWREGFPALKKGGKYRLFVPYEKAYKNGNSQAPQGALCFYIEFINFGKSGTLTKPIRAIQKLH